MDTTPPRHAHRAARAVARRARSRGARAANVRIRGHRGSTTCSLSRSSAITASCCPPSTISRACSTLRVARRWSVRAGASSARRPARGVLVHAVRAAARREGLQITGTPAGMARRRRPGARAARGCWRRPRAARRRCEPARRDRRGGSGRQLRAAAARRAPARRRRSRTSSCTARAQGKTVLVVSDARRALDAIAAAPRQRARRASACR